jgi:hypothetical protein
MAAYSGYQVPPQYAQPPPAQHYGQRQEYPSNSFYGSSAPSVNSFDPYASTASAPPPVAPTYNNYAAYQPVSAPYGIPPSFSNEEMTTAPLPPSHFNVAFQPHASAPPYYNPPPPAFAVAGPHPQYQRSPSAVSDITMFENPVPATPKVKTTEDALALAEKGGFSEAVADPALIAEQERILQEIQVRRPFCFGKEHAHFLFLWVFVLLTVNVNPSFHSLQDRAKMERIRANYIPKSSHKTSQRALVPYDGRLHVPPPPTSLVEPESRSQKQSIAHGGVAVLDPKKDKRKATRKMKTAAGAVGGAVVGGLVLGPVGVVLGAGGAAVATNKVAKARDKRKQQDFEQKNFQAGASRSATAKGDAAFA